jgi:hypothetical protein
MTGEQIVDTCRDIAARQFEGDPLGAAQHEIELLRTKVLELSKVAAQLRADLREQDREFQREARDIAAEARWEERQSRDGEYGSF